MAPIFSFSPVATIFLGFRRGADAGGVEFDFFNQNPCYAFPTCPAHLNDSGSSFFLNVWSFPIAFNYGFPIPIEFTMRLSAGDGGEAVFFNTVTLEFDLPDGAFVTAASGAAYNVVGPLAVPGPPTLLLMTIGAVLLAGRAVRR